MIIEKVLMPASLTKNFEIWVLQDYEYFPMDGLQSKSICEQDKMSEKLQKGMKDEGWWMMKDDDF